MASWARKFRYFGFQFAAIRHEKTWTMVLALALLLGTGVAGARAQSAAGPYPFSSIFGVNYSRQYSASPLPPTQAMQQIKQHFNMVKLFQFEADVVQAAVANGLEIALGTLNSSLAEFAAGTPTTCAACDAYVAMIAPYKNNIKVIILANEPFTTPGLDPAQLVPAMRNLSAALKRANPPLDIPVTTVLAFSTLGVSYPPADGAFKPQFVADMNRLFAYLGQAGNANFIFLNVYPYFAIKENPVAIRIAYALFQQPVGGFANLFAAQYTAFRAAMSKLTPAATLPVLIGETGWASAGSNVTIAPSDAPVPGCTDRLIATICNEGVYVKGFIDWDKLQTPPIVSFLFEMYDEAHKPGSPDEPHFGLFAESGARKLFPNIVTGGGSILNATTKASTLLEFRSRADQVGEEGNRGQVQISGTFAFNGSLDLTHAVVFLDRLLVEDEVIIGDEIGGGGELVVDPNGEALLPLFLQARQGSTESEARYETTEPTGPKVQMDILSRDPGSGVYEFNARVKRLSIPQSADACEEGGATAALTTSFTIADSIQSVMVSTRTDWKCRRSQLRSPPPR
jgi:exo-beta-1,3-glucanase (GH17 family)